MQITVRPATTEDIPRLLDLYREAEPEQTARKPIWALTDGLDEPIERSIADAIGREGSWLVVGCIDAVPVGFALATIEGMLGRADGARIGRIRLIYTQPEARGVGVGDSMLEHILAELRPLGIGYFDAPVGPGQRLTKNFFEGHGFAARSIIMHHADKDDEQDG